MQVSRRSFLGSLSAAAALPRAASATPQADSEDPLGVRPDFVAAQQGVYLNSPYITPSPRQVTRAAQAFLEAKGRNPVLLGEMMQQSRQAREKFARLIGASTPEVGILFATSEGENIVARALDLKAGDNVVIDDLHYETTFVLYRHLVEKRGIDLRIVKSQDGRATAERFASKIDARTRLVSVAWVSHQNGYCHDLAALARLAHDRGAYLYADAIQGIGMLSLDVRAVGIDFLTAGTYKWLLGGYGVAPFFVREELLDNITLDRMGSLHIAEDLGNHRYELFRDGRKFGYATQGFGSIYQLSAALDYLLKIGVKNIERHTVSLAHRLRNGLVSQGFSVWTPRDNRSAIVTFAHGKEVEKVRSRLEAARISFSFKNGDRNIRVGAALFNNASDIKRFLEVTGDFAS